jgi:hypothetical protein
VLDVNKTLAVRWNERGVRGWGNYWPYLRTLHFAAALLGRRFLVLHDHSLPTDYLMLGGRLSWSLPRGELSDYLVVQPAELKSWNVAHNESGMIGFLSTLADVQHVFLNVTSTLSISKYAILMKECPKQEHAAAFLWCMGRLVFLAKPSNGCGGGPAARPDRSAKLFCVAHADVWCGHAHPGRGHNTRSELHAALSCLGDHLKTR